MFFSGAAEAACPNTGGTISSSSSNATNCQALSGGGSLTVNGGVTYGNSSTSTSTDLVVVSSQTAGVTIANSGTLSSATNKGSGTVFLTGPSQNVTITNNGTITSSGEDAIHGGKGSTQITSGSISVTNNGTISTTGTTGSTNGQGIDFDNTGGTVAITITNYGIITTAMADAMRPGEKATVNNYGSITSNAYGGDTGDDGIDFQAHGAGSTSNAGTVNNYAGASITGARHGITGQGSITVDNAGTITGNLGSGINLDTTAGTTYITNRATGIISGTGTNTNDGDGIDVDYLAVIKNYGKIYAYGTPSAASGFLSEAVTIGGGEIDNYAGGLLYSDQRGITVNNVTDGNAYGPTTIYNEGTITGANGEAINITSASANTITNLGTINGSIVITSEAGTTAGDTTITNKGTINGSVTTGSGNDTFNLYTGSIIGKIDGGAGTDTINLYYGTGAGTLANVVNVEFLNVNSGLWTISDTQTYSSGVTVGNGAGLIVNGSLAGSPVVLLNGSLLAGNGTVGSLTAQGGSTVSPGNSIGTLTVSGDYHQMAGATYAAQVTPGSNVSDLIAATGAATIDSGAILNVSKIVPGSYTIGSVYTVLTAAGGVTGTYTLTGDTALSAFYNLTAKYGANAVYLAVTQTSAFANAATTKNQLAAANGLQSVAEGNAVRDAVGYLATFAQASQALNQLSGEAHASIKSAFLDDSRFVRSAAFDRLRLGAGCADNGSQALRPNSGAGATPCQGGLTAWARGFGSWGQINGDGNAAALKHSTGGFFAGYDGDASKGVRLGFLSGYSNSTYKDAGVASSGSSDTYHVGVYASSDWGRVTFRLAGAYSGSEISTTRNVAFPGYADQLKGKYQAGTSQVFSELGYRLGSVRTPAGAVAIEPFGGLAFVNVRTSAFTEKGGAAALSAGAEDTDVGYSTLGLHTAHSFALGGVPLFANGTFAWRHAFGDIAPSSTLNFSGANPFTVAGAPLSRNVGVVELGLATPVTGNISTGISYTGQFGDRTNDHGVRGTVSWRF